MTTHKTLKHRVRARAAKTGEPYTSAGSQLLRKVDPPPPDATELVGKTDEAMLRGLQATCGEVRR